MLIAFSYCRKQKLEEAEQRRLAAEEEMEARRLELIKEGGYWKNRMAQDEKTQALQEESIIKAGTQVGYWKNRMAQDENIIALQEDSIIKA